MMAEAKKTKKKAKRVFTCKKCGAEFASGMLVGRHYDENPDHRTKPKQAKKKTKKAKAAKRKTAKRGLKPKAARTGYAAILSQAIAEIESEIKVLNEKKKKLQKLLK